MRMSGFFRADRLTTGPILAPRCSLLAGLDEPSQMLLFDAQTSGGLLLCVPQNQVDILMERASQIGQPLWVVGEIIEGKGIEVI